MGNPRGIWHAGHTGPNSHQYEGYGVRVEDKDQLLISHDTGEYLGWSEVSEIDEEMYGQMDDNI